MWHSSLREMPVQWLYSCIEGGHSIEAESNMIRPVLSGCRASWLQMFLTWISKRNEHKIEVMLMWTIHKQGNNTFANMRTSHYLDTTCVICCCVLHVLLLCVCYITTLHERFEKYVKSLQIKFSFKPEKEMIKLTTMVFYGIFVLGF